MAFNPNAVFISPSTLADFDKCPQLYYYRSVYRTPRGLKIQQITPALALGQAVHDTIDQFVRTKQNNFDFIWGHLSGEKGGFITEEDEYKKRALEMLERFWRNDHFKETEMFKMPNFPKVDLGPNLILTGKLDWIEKEGDFYHVIDFKTGKNEEKADSLQLPIYSVLASGLLNSENIKASYWYLDKDDTLTSFALPLIAETKKLLFSKGEIVQMARQTNSYRCQSGKEECYACRDMKAIAEGKGKLVTMDTVRKQEIYILPKIQVETSSELPF
jgi:hypothetical protein